jgi:hypothetical protein
MWRRAVWYKGANFWDFCLLLTSIKKKLMPSGWRQQVFFFSFTRWCLFTTWRHYQNSCIHRHENLSLHQETEDPPLTLISYTATNSICHASLSLQNTSCHSIQTIPHHVMLMTTFSLLLQIFGSPSTPILENPEYQTRWYFKYFLGKREYLYALCQNMDGELMWRVTTLVGKNNSLGTRRIWCIDMISYGNISHCK